MDSLPARPIPTPQNALDNVSNKVLVAGAERGSGGGEDAKGAAAQLDPFRSVTLEGCWAGRSGVLVCPTAAVRLCA